ncbi:MAG: hypothetical protein WKF89_18555, partial [Chitinophagaceae bacterium]
SYYEGFNKEGEAYWLEIYRRNELLPVNFLADLCDICLQTRIGQLYATPWKSSIIKGIPQGTLCEAGAEDFAAVDEKTSMHTSQALINDNCIKS